MASWRGKLALRIFLLLPAPLVAGYIIFLTGIYRAKDLVPLYIYLPIAVVFLAFWVWVGSSFASVGLKRLPSFLIGNSSTFLAAAIGLYLSQGLEASFLNKVLGGVSAFFFLPVAELPGNVVSRLLGVVDNDALIFLGSLLLMVLAFSIGFFSRRKIGS